MPYFVARGIEIFDFKGKILYLLGAERLYPCGRWGRVAPFARYRERRGINRSIKYLENQNFLQDAQMFDKQFLVFR